jgi:hypothetical protein
MLGQIPAHRRFRVLSFERFPMSKHHSVGVGSPISSNRPLLLESDPERLARLHRGLGRAGVNAVAVRRIAEVERWPSDTFVITDFERFTTLWLEVGATCVIVLADTAEQGVAACQRGATRWVPRNCTVRQLLAVINAEPSCRKMAHSTTARV